jgi:HWE histidine kinase
VEANALAYFEGAGAERRAVSLGGTVQDITERKEREEKEHLLMREVNHRAKNMLNVVDSIAHQTAARNAEGFIERFSERIQALSANQDLLVRSEWKGVDIADLARAQLAHFDDLNPAKQASIGSEKLVTNHDKRSPSNRHRSRHHIVGGAVNSQFAGCCPTEPVAVRTRSSTAVRARRGRPLWSMFARFIRSGGEARQAQCESSGELRAYAKEVGRNTRSIRGTALQEEWRRSHGGDAGDLARDPPLDHSKRLAA